MTGQRKGLTLLTVALLAALGWTLWQPPRTSSPSGEGAAVAEPPPDQMLGNSIAGLRPTKEPGILAPSSAVAARPEVQLGAPGALEIVVDDPRLLGIEYSGGLPLRLTSSPLERSITLALVSLPYTVRQLTPGRHDWTLGEGLFGAGLNSGSVALDGSGRRLVLDTSHWHRLTGTVTTSAGSPAANVQVLLSRQGFTSEERRRTWATTVTDASGRYVIAPVPTAGLYTLEAVHETWGSGSSGPHLITSLNTQVPDVTLSVGSLVTGRVLLPGNQPAEGVPVQLARWNSSTESTTDAEGIYRFEGVPPCSGSVRVLAPRFLPARLPLAVPLEHEGLSETIWLPDCLLREGRYLTGTLSDPEGAPAAGLTVRGRPWIDESDGTASDVFSFEQSTYSDRRGSFRLGPFSSPTIDVSVTSIPPVSALVALDQEVHLTIPSPQRKEIRVLLISDRQGAALARASGQYKLHAGAGLGESPRSFQTDSAGVATLQTNLWPQDSLILGLTTSGHQSLIRRDFADLLRSHGQAPIPLELKACEPVTLVVEDSSGQRLPGARVVVTWPQRALSDLPLEGGWPSPHLLEDGSGLSFDYGADADGTIVIPRPIPDEGTTYAIIHSSGLVPALCELSPGETRRVVLWKATEQ